MASDAQFFLLGKVKGNLQAHIRHENTSYLLYVFLNYDLRFIPGIFHMSKDYLFL